MADREIPSPRRDDPVILKWGRGAISAKMKPNCLPILEMWLTGATLREVGAHHNVGAERVREIILQIRHRSYKAKNLSLRSGDTLSLATPADHLLLEVRAANCLKNEGIETVGDLVAKTPVELLRIPNFGKRSLREIQVILAKFGFSLAPDPPKSAEKRVNRTLTEMPLGPPTRPLYEPIGLKHGISELKLPALAHKCLLNDNLVTVGDVVSKSAAYLLGLPGLGERSFREIALRLVACGFPLKNVPIKRRREIDPWKAEIKILKGKIRVLKRRIKELEG